MRRPSGFDREPEPREQDSPSAEDWGEPADWDEPEDWPGPAADPAEAASESQDQPRQLGRLPRVLTGLPWVRRRRATGDAVDETTGETAGDPELDPELDPAADLAADLAAGLAITTDLSDVRDRAALEFDGLKLSSSELAAVTPEPQESGLRVAERELKAAIAGRKRRERREQRRFTWHVRQRRRPWLVAGAAVLAVALFVLVGVFTPLMSVREVRVEGATRDDPAAVQAALEPLLGTPLALVDHGEVHRALVPFPLIQRYAIETIPPHTLVVRLEERVPVLAIPSDAGFDLVDPAGVTVEQSEALPEGVPLAEGVAATRSSAAFSEVARVLRDMPSELRAQFATATASTGQDVSFVLHSGVQVVWGEAAETPRKAVVLTAMLNALGERPVSLIDVSSSEAPIFR